MAYYNGKKIMFSELNGKKMIFSPRAIISGGALPDYLISHGDTINELYFNTNYDLDDYLSGLTYDQEITVGGVTIPNCAYIGLNLYATNDDDVYIMFAVVSTTITWLYSTDVYSEFSITEAGWQVNSLNISPAITADLSTMDAGFLEIKDYFVAEAEIGFGDLHSGESILVYQTRVVQTPEYSANNPSQRGDLPTLTIYKDIPLNATIKEVYLFWSYGGYLKIASGPVTPYGINVETAYITSIVNDQLRVTVSSETDSYVDTILSTHVTEGKWVKQGTLVIMYD